MEIPTDTPLSEDKARRYFTDVLMGLEYCQFNINNNYQYSYYFFLFYCYCYYYFYYFIVIIVLSFFYNNSFMLLLFK